MFIESVIWIKTDRSINDSKSETSPSVSPTATEPSEVSRDDGRTPVLQYWLYF